MYVIVTPPPLPPNGARALRRVYPVGLLTARPVRAIVERPLEASDRDDAGDVVACCGCAVPNGTIEAPLGHRPVPEPAGAGTPPMPPQVGVARVPGELEALERRLRMRIDAVEAHVDALSMAFARRDAAERAARDDDDAFERAEDRLFGAVIELLSAAWERRRVERQRARRR